MYELNSRKTDVANLSYYDEYRIRRSLLVPFLSFALLHAGSGSLTSRTAPPGFWTR